MKKLFIYTLLLFAVHLVSQNETRQVRLSSKKEDSSVVKLRTLNVNSEKSEFCPVIHNNIFYFVSSRYNEMGIVYEDQNNVQTTDIFSSRIIDSVTFSSVKALDAPLNTKYNEGPFCFNKNGNVIYFTANDASKKLKIFKSTRLNQKWSAPEELSFCPPGYSSCHPAISEDEKTLVFASDVKGGYGGMDLYVTHFENGYWSKPVNLGRKINSEANEVFPFLATRNILYYSSNKKEGLGGLDLYRIDLMSDKNATAQHLKFPMNSRADDFGIWVDSTGEKGYLSSDRIKKNKDDIFYFYQWIPPVNEFKPFASKNKFCFSFFEESYLTGKDTLDLTYEWSFGDGTKERGEKVKHCYVKPGEYTIELNIVQKVSGELFQSQANYQLMVEEPEKLFIHANDTIAPGKEVIFSSLNSLKKYKVSKTYWSFGDGLYNDGSIVKHKYKKQGDYTVEMLVEANNETTGKIEKLKVQKKVTVKDQGIYAKK